MSCHCSKDHDDADFCEGIRLNCVMRDMKGMSCAVDACNSVYIYIGVV